MACIWTQSFEVAQGIEMKRVYRLSHQEARRRASQDCLSAPDGWMCTISEPSRSLEQNAAQWPILQAFASQKQLVVNGVLVWATDEDWKDVLTAAFRNEMRVALGLDGRMVLLGQRTREFGKKKFSDWLEFLHATAAAMEIELSYDKEKA
jgi:hypothetical protein